MIEYGDREENIELRDSSGCNGEDMKKGFMRERVLGMRNRW